MINCFNDVWAVDTEWGFRDERVDEESAWEPVVLCLVGLHSGRRFAFWGRDSSLRAFLNDHIDDLFVAHYAVAEIKYLLRLGLPIPQNWHDTFVAWRWLTNTSGHLEADLIDALHQLRLPHLAPASKKELRDNVLHLRFDAESLAQRQEITEYCYSDCDGCAALYQHVASRVNTSVMAHWIEFLKAIARMELRGIPFDIDEYGRIQRLQPVIKASLIKNVNSTWPVFEGETFKKRKFLRWCKRVDIDWPVKMSERTGKPYHCVDRDTLKDMENRHPLIANVREVCKTLSQFEDFSLTVDPILRRHFFSTSVFRSVTGRNQPRNFVFGAPKWMRYLIVPESPGHVLVYVDYLAQEIGIAAALSKDPAMRAIYEADDCHMNFAVRAGAVPVGATKNTAAYRNIRKNYKTVNLGVMFGQTAYGAASRLGIRVADAEILLADHRKLFPTFWRWSERMVQGSYARGWIATPCGWRAKVLFPSNDRTWMNWPMQATGGDIMRLTVAYLDRQNASLLAVIHDGFLLSCRRDQLADLRAAVDYACNTAVEHVLPGFPLRWEFSVYDRGRYEDEDGEPLWNQLKAIMENADADTIA